MLCKKIFSKSIKLKITDSSESSRKRKVKASKDETFILLADAIKNVGEPLGQN